MTAALAQMLDDAALRGKTAEFRRRRDAICTGLSEVPGFRCRVPAGAFYAFANVTGTGMESSAVADLILDEAGVAGVNGGCFGEYGEGYVRFSYANSLSNIMEAIERIKKVSVRWADKVAA